MVVNKFFVLLPAMFAVRKLDGEDPTTVFLLRFTYFSVQTIIFLMVLYLYSQAKYMCNSTHTDVIIYVPSPSQPFSEKNAKPQFKKVRFGDHIMTIARSLLASTFFGIVLTTGLHLYKGVIIGLCMQTIMSPFNLFENVLTKVFLLNGTLKIDQPQGLAHIFGAKLKEELTNDDEVVDERGELIAIEKSVVTEEKNAAIKDFNDIVLDTWDEGSKANIQPFMESVNKDNVNSKVSDSGWTPIMIMAAISVKETADVLQKLKSLGSDPRIEDGEGWNALHWAAFHSSVDGARFLLSSSGFNGYSNGLHLAKDKEGKTPLNLAYDERNLDVAKEIENIISFEEKNISSDSLTDQYGLRQRK